MKYMALMLLLNASLSLRAAELETQLFEEQLSRQWQEVFRDDCFDEWTENWFLDGMKAQVTNGDKGMTIDTAKGYAVLWTEREFEGDLKIEYDFQRVDASDKGVNIIYVQARGKGTAGFGLDIAEWSQKRKLAAMSDYFNNMDTYHISYATFPTDYIRGRRYLPLLKKGLNGTELEGTVMKTRLFETGQWVHVTIVKREKDLWVEYKGKSQTLHCHLVNSDKPGIRIGRIGLRLMPGRESLFKNFSVSTAK